MSQKRRVRVLDQPSKIIARPSTRPASRPARVDRKFHWAEARIAGDAVVVSSRDVPAPVAVRYAWGDSPKCNLFNKAGLPASRFRTDDWAGITAANKDAATGSNEEVKIEF